MISIGSTNFCTHFSICCVSETHQSYSSSIYHIFFISYRPFLPLFLSPNSPGNGFEAFRTNIPSPWSENRLIQGFGCPDNRSRFYIVSLRPWLLVRECCEEILNRNSRCGANSFLSELVNLGLGSVFLIFRQFEPRCS